ncbi:MAG TPA: hypothetical protein VFQ77_11450 [Pseudonocardiaceae bacterium]|nr:hypothetical protein [Pseudonocardiaceae bacterium]
MPIRTHRGRAAVYRAIWGWPVRSPRHLAALVLVLATVAAGLALVLPDGTSSPTTATPPSSARVNPFDPTSRAELPGARPDLSASRLGEAPHEALTVAEAWVRAFLTVPEGISSVQWAEQMRPYTTAETLPTLQSVDPANVPDARVIGTPRTVTLAAGKAEVDVPTTAGVVRLLLVPTPAGWRVSSFEQAG